MADSHRGSRLFNQQKKHEISQRESFKAMQGRCYSIHAKRQNLPNRKKIPGRIPARKTRIKARPKNQSTEKIMVPEKGLEPLIFRLHGDRCTNLAIPAFRELLETFL